MNTLELLETVVYWVCHWDWLVDVWCHVSSSSGESKCSMSQLVWYGNNTTAGQCSNCKANSQILKLSLRHVSLRQATLTSFNTTVTVTHHDWIYMPFLPPVWAVSKSTEFWNVLEEEAQLLVYFLFSLNPRRAADLLFHGCIWDGLFCVFVNLGAFFCDFPLFMCFIHGLDGMD